MCFFLIRAVHIPRIFYLCVAVCCFLIASILVLAIATFQLDNLSTVIVPILSAMLRFVNYLYIQFISHTRRSTIHRQQYIHTKYELSILHLLKVN